MSQEMFESAEELFVIDGVSDSCYLYAPLRRVVVSMNRAAVGSVSRYLQQNESALKAGDIEVIDHLRSAGLFADPIPKPPVTPTNYLFRPHEVTIFPTTRCNLRCIYCYANAGIRQVDMPWEIAQAAIDLIIENARAVGRDDFILGFHGGGEPTVNWDLIRQATLYARQRAKDTGLDVKIHCATNGVLSPSQCEFVVNNFTGMNISLDGPADIQDRQRPLANGKGSFTYVMQTLDYFSEKKFPFGIRVTLTANEGHRLNDIVRFIHQKCPQLDQVHVEPVWQCGRCQTTGERPPSEEQFIKCFAEAYDLAHDLGFSLFYSGARLDVLTDKFCAAPGDGFSVTPEGIVSSCYEVTDPADPRAELFHYGYYDKTRKQFSIDLQRVARLRKLRVENIPHCQDCFCKWHCAGDCLAKALPGVNPNDHQGSPRCNLNREITRLQLKRLADRASGQAIKIKEKEL
jgi:uncharacterized protein